MTAPRVLHVAQPTDGGVAAYLAAVAADQLSRGWTVMVACPDGEPLNTDLAGAGVSRLRWPAGRAPGPGTVGEVLRLAQLVATARPRVVHLHSSKAGLAGRLAVRGALPTLFSPHGWSWLAGDGLLAGVSLGWERAAARWTHQWVCVGEGEAVAGRRRGLPDRLAVVRNGVDLTRFSPQRSGPQREPGAEGWPDRARAEARARLGLPGSGPLAVCVGRVTRQKGQDVLLAAWPRVRRECPTAALVCAGDGDARAALAARNVVGTRFVGAVGDVRPWYAAADVVVLPSRWEGMALTVLEAMAAGRPVVASAIPGLAEAVPAEAGALVPSEDPVSLAAALVRLLADPSAAAARGRTAAAYAAAEFDVRRTFDALAELTRRALTASAAS